MELRITHTSDTHGHFPYVRGMGEILVHSGDFLPNRHGVMVDANGIRRSAGLPEREEEFQAEWLEANMPQIKDWVGKRPFLFCPGNHDYADPTVQMRAAGIDAVNLTEEPYYYNGVPFLGFPYCPLGVRPWNYATNDKAMKALVEGRIRKPLLKIGKEVVLVAHCPPMNIFDTSRGMHYGNEALADMLLHGGQQNPIALLCGHIHYDHGFMYAHGMLISQAATTVHNLVLNVTDD